MANLLGTAVNSLSVYQTALATTSNNIANSNNEDYNRQRVELSTQIPNPQGRSFVGTGVQVDQISRAYDDFTALAIRDAESSVGRGEILEDFATRVNTLLSDDGSSLAPSLQAFYGSIADVSSDPSSIPPRSALLGEADNLASQFNSLAAEIDDLNSEVNGRVINQVAEINTIATGIVDLNNAINAVGGQNGSTFPNDLFDQRDALLKDLSSLVSVTTVQQQDGILNVLIGVGQLLVSGATQNVLQSVPSGRNPNEVSVAIQSNGALVDITSSLAGGSLSGLLSFQQTELDGVQNVLGRLAIGVSSLVNAQHVEGQDLNGNLGTNVFSVGQPNVFANTNNTGAATVAVTVTTASDLQASDYELRFDGTNFNVVRQSDNATVANSTGPTIAVDGLTFTIAGGAPATGDRFYAEPYANSAAGFSNLLTDPRSIAAALPTKTEEAVANVGTGTITRPVISDATDVNLQNTVTLTFNDPPTTFDQLDVTLGVTTAGVAFTSGNTITINGNDFVLSGVPQPGDVFTLQANTNATTDNGNSLLLDRTQTIRIFDGGTNTLAATYDRAVADAGIRTQQLQATLASDQGILTNLNDRRESISGVNLDEEAGDLLRFQQAFQALSRTIQVAQATFDSILQAT